jgi:hypothetical protein
LGSLCRHTQRSRSWLAVNWSRLVSIRTIKQSTLAVLCINHPSRTRGLSGHILPGDGRGSTVEMLFQSSAGNMSSKSSFYKVSPVTRPCRRFRNG